MSAPETVTVCLTGRPTYVREVAARLAGLVEILPDSMRRRRSLRPGRTTLRLVVRLPYKHLLEQPEFWDAVERSSPPSS